MTVFVYHSLLLCLILFNSHYDCLIDNYVMTVFEYLVWNQESELVAALILTALTCRQIDPVIRGIKLFVSFLLVCHVIGCMMNLFFFDPRTFPRTYYQYVETSGVVGWSAADFNTVSRTMCQLTDPKLVCAQIVLYYIHAR